MIDNFSGQYGFLSNFAPCQINYKGLIFSSAESAFQAQKDLSRRKDFVNYPAGLAKHIGRQVTLRSDWELVKDEEMYSIVLEKFLQNPDYREQLLATGDEELVEGNTWYDCYWGVYNGVGQNKLGKILMRVREQLLKIDFS